MKHYGEDAYPYGFKMHMMNIIDETPDDDEWFLKVNVTITDAANEEHDTVCEAKVGGTTDNPEVTYFFVY